MLQYYHAVVSHIISECSASTKYLRLAFRRAQHINSPLPRIRGEGHWLIVISSGTASYYFTL